MADRGDDMPGGPGDAPDAPPPRRSFRRRGPEDPEATGRVERPRGRGFGRGRPQAAGDDDLEFRLPGDAPEETPRSRRRDGRAARAPGAAARPSGARRAGGGGGRRGGGRGGGGGPRAGAGGAAALQQPAVRLAIAVTLAAILVIVLLLVVRNCQRNELVDSYRNYMTDVAQLTEQSAQQGRQLRDILSNSEGRRPPELKQRVAQLSNEAAALAERADGLDPPDALSAPQRSLVTALQYRVTGLSSLADALPELIASEDRDFAANSIAEPMKRFLASDVIYEDSFAGPAARALEEDDIGGVEVPPAQPFLPNTAYASTAGAARLLPGLKRDAAAGDDAAGGNLRGTAIVSTEAVPEGTRLTPGEPVTVQSSELLKWKVTVENGGDFVEENVVVSARIAYPDAPDEPETVEDAIESIGPGETASIELPGPTNVPFGEQGTLTISVKPVPRETRTDNNTAEYPVRITI